MPSSVVGDDWSAGSRLGAVERRRGEDGGGRNLILSLSDSVREPELGLVCHQWESEGRCSWRVT